MHSTLYENNNKINNSYCSMKQYESFVISQWNVQELRSSAFGLKSNNSGFIDGFKGRGRGQGRLTNWQPSRLWGSKKAPWSDTGKDLRGESLSGLKLNIQILLNLLEKVKMMYGLSQYPLTNPGKYPNCRC